MNAKGEIPMKFIRLWVTTEFFLNCESYRASVHKKANSKKKNIQHFSKLLSKTKIISLTSLPNAWVILRRSHQE